MNTTTSVKQNVIRSCLGIVLSVFIFVSAGLQLPVVDSKADNYFSESITKAGVSYATCRIINASVSIVQGSSLQLEPAGVGLSLAAGQVLDPINDMTERLSDVLVMAITSLGVQELIYELSLTLAPPIFATFLFALSILLCFQNDRVTRVRKTTISILFLIGITRFCLPISSIANEFLQIHFFDDKIAKANKELALGVADLNKLKDVSLPEAEGVMKTIENSASFLKQKTIHFKEALTTLANNSGSIIENLLQLTFLYVGIFLVQVIMLPLLIFWILFKIINALFCPQIPMMRYEDRI